MSGLLDVCSDLFQTSNLYEVLGIQKEASASEVKRGYHRVSLKVHPDRVQDEEKEVATQKFQALGKVYSILSDKEKRAIYDESGEVDDENDIDSDRDWYDYWRLLFAKVSVKDIEEFEKKYKGSDEELEDLKSAYMDYEGDMEQIMENMLCSTVEDEDRFRNILKKLVKKGELPDFKCFSKEAKSKQKERKRKANKEAAEAEEYRKELGIDEQDSLKAMILKKNQSREAAADSFFAQLEAKYAQPKKAKGSAQPKKAKGKSK